MPVIVNTQSMLTRAANTTLAQAFFPRAMEWTWPKLCGSTISTSMVEPFTIDGAAPLPVQFKGFMASRGISSFKIQVPNLLFKMIEEYNRGQIEFDQTNTFLRRINQIGVRVAQSPEYLFAKKLLNANVSTSNTVTFEGSAYQQTIDNLPFFHASHTTYAASTQSNVVQGVLPNTLPGLAANDPAVNANEMLRDFVTVLNKFKTFKDNTGATIYASIDTKKSVVVVVPSALETTAMLAFKTVGTIGGSNGNSSGSTTNVGPQLVKDVYVSGLLDGCLDIEANDGSLILPTNPTDYWIFIVDDFVKPFYFQNFRPLKGNETMPPGYDPAAEADKIIEESDKLGLKINIQAATLYAQTVVEHNLGATGANAQLSVVTQEKFFASSRSRMNFVYGPWWTGIRVHPASSS